MRQIKGWAVRVPEGATCFESFSIYRENAIDLYLRLNGLFPVATPYKRDLVWEKLKRRGFKSVRASIMGVAIE